MIDVVIYSIANCTYCDQAKSLLEEEGIDYQEVRVDLNPERMSEMLALAEGRRSFPQILINKKAIGGFNELRLLKNAGKLNN